MKEKYYYPLTFNKSHFHYPNCHENAEQKWSIVFSRLNTSPVGMADVPGLVVSLCTHCSRYCVWQFEKLISPDNTGIERANEDLPEDIVADYNEAASIVQKSPRGAAALLRLAIQKLCAALGEKGMPEFYTLMKLLNDYG